jgi:multiple sugar transport system permease protein
MSSVPKVALDSPALARTAATSVRRARITIRASDSLRYLVLIAGAVTMILPFLWMLSTALKAPGSVLTVTPDLVPDNPTLASFRRVMDVVPLGRMFVNSLLATVICVAGQIATSALAAYAFSRMFWRGRDALFTLYLATLMIPSQVTITPLFILMRQFGWINTYQGLILPGLVSAFGTFVLRQAMLNVPRAYEEAAFLDGANHWQVFSGVVVPMIRPALATFGVLSTMAVWNDFLWPLFVTNDAELMTLPVGLSLLHGEHGSDWNLVMAGAVIAVVPLILAFVAAQRTFINGMMQSGLKG